VRDRRTQPDRREARRTTCTRPVSPVTADDGARRAPDPDAGPSKVSKRTGEDAPVPSAAGAGVGAGDAGSAGEAGSAGSGASASAQKPHAAVLTQCFTPVRGSAMSGTRQPGAGHVSPNNVHPRKSFSAIAADAAEEFNPRLQRRLHDKRGGGNARCIVCALESRADAAVLLGGSMYRAAEDEGGGGGDEAAGVAPACSLPK
jgi:hypothetical protein